MLERNITSSIAAGDPEKAKSAAIFYKRWMAAEADEGYAAAKADWKKKYG
ncbi:hypothetical protein AB6802_13240 [Mesorhizobium sp. RCC_202]